MKFLTHLILIFGIIFAAEIIYFQVLVFIKNYKKKIDLKE